jgi:hypothetical protein
MIGGSSPGRDWGFFSSPPRPDQLWGPHSLLSSGYQVFFLGGVNWPRREADHSHLVPRSKCVELYLYCPNTPSWCCAQLKKHGDYFNFTLATCVWMGANYILLLLSLVDVELGLSLGGGAVYVEGVWK